MKRSNEPKYDIIACYNPREDETYHFLKFRDNKDKFQIPNTIVDYGVKFIKLFPNTEMLTYAKAIYEPKNNRIYVMLVSKGNPYGLKENNKELEIN